MRKPLISFDYAIKYLLRNKADYDIVEAFISALLAVVGYPPIKIKALLDTESNRESAEHKKSIADLLVQDEQGRNYIIEIERNVRVDFLSKAFFNTSRLAVDTARSGEPYEKIEKIFHINLLYFAPPRLTAPIQYGRHWFKEIPSESSLVPFEQATNSSFLNYNNIFPEYFVVFIPLFNDLIHQEIDEWLYMLKHSEVKPEFQSSYMSKVVERLSMLQMTDQERNEYMQYVQEKVEEHARFLGAAEQRYTQGRSEGFLEGVAQEKKETAKKLLKAGISEAIIIESTGLSLEELAQIKRIMPS
jgi:predicted transposase/invertase (TIGR01784 family)